MAPTFALLVPVTSAGGSDLDRVAGKVKHALDTFSPSPGHDVVVVFGLDTDDPLLDTPSGEQALRRASGGVVRSADARCTRFVKQPRPHGTPFRMCDMWTVMAATAVRELAASFFVLIGDDVELVGCPSPGWTELVLQKFTEIAARHKLASPTFGCVALNDVSSPAFPTFPVIGKTHLDIFGRVAPPLFVNQDADPFLFAVYRRFSASAFAASVRVRNSVGGAAPRVDPPGPGGVHLASGHRKGEAGTAREACGNARVESRWPVQLTACLRAVSGSQQWSSKAPPPPPAGPAAKRAEGAKAPRYERQHVVWQFGVLHDAAAAVAAHLPGVKGKLTVDVCVPSYRADRDLLTRIARMESAETDH
eukprot:gene11134-17115_t